MTCFIRQIIRFTSSKNEIESEGGKRRWQSVCCQIRMSRIMKSFVSAANWMPVPVTGRGLCYDASAFYHPTQEPLNRGVLYVGGYIIKT